MASKEIEALLKSIDDKFGKGSLMRYGDSIHQQVSVIPTGIPNLDKALGIGGLPKGRIVEIFGPESSGKTTLSLHVLAQAQKMGGMVAFVDVEYALDPTYAQALGVNMEDVLLSQPDSGEDALEIVERIVRSGQVDVVVIDSVAALVPRAEINGEMGDSLPGLQARLMSQACRKLVAAISQTNTLVIFINQLREKIGGASWGSNEVTSGGKALKFYCSMRLDIRRIGAIKDGDHVLGNKTRLKVVKNKFSAPYKTVEFDIMYGEGISQEGDLLELAIVQGVITKSGAWFAHEGKNFAQGKEKARLALKDTEFFDKIKEQVAAVS